MNDWNKAIILIFAAALFGLVGYHMAQQERLNDQLKRMEVAVAVCGDVAAYFAPNDELTAGAELSQPPKVSKR